MQERILGALAFVLIAVLLGSAYWPHFAEPDPISEPQTPIIEIAPLSSTIQVEILNGCGVAQVAARLRNKARAMGLDVIHEGNAPTFDHLHTLVIDLSGDLDQAQQVANLLGISHLIQQKKEDQFHLADVSIIIGRDYRRIGLLDTNK